MKEQNKGKINRKNNKFYKCKSNLMHLNLKLTPYQESLLLMLILEKKLKRKTFPTMILHFNQKSIQEVNNLPVKINQQCAMNDYMMI